MSGGRIRRVGAICFHCRDYFEADLKRETDVCWDCGGCRRHRAAHKALPRPENHKPQLELHRVAFESLIEGLINHEEYRRLTT
jgi:hypothetical protein